MATIWNVCKDPGGTNGVLAVEDQLRKLGHNTMLIPNGQATELLSKAGRKFFTLEQALEITPIPDILVTSMCSEGGIGRNLVPIMRKSDIPVVALQDCWGGRLWTEWADIKFRPDYICVNDEVSADIIVGAWPDFQRDHIEITGFPAMDKYADLDTKGTATKVKSTLGIAHDKPIILYAGQVQGEGGVISEVVAALNEVGADIYFVPRTHPRMKKDAPEEVPKQEQALANFTGGRLVDSSACDTPSVTATADLVISAYSTVNVEAANLGKPNISVLYPETGMKLFKAEFPHLEDFPLVQLGCSAKAIDRKSLVNLIQTALDHKLGLEDAQKMIRPDGRNALRVARLIHLILSRQLT